ncbi:AIPR family protein [Ileibacterium valens]|uniref:AIPR family protein n=1 Tax=Ileibacterium valens TaxID=1862668 RepID=UPI003D2F31A8
MDGYSFKESEGILVLIVTNLESAANKNGSDILSKKQIDNYDQQFELMLEALKDNDFADFLEESTAISDLKELITNSNNDIKKYEFLIITDRHVTRTARNIEIRKIGKIPREVQVWSLERLFNNSIEGQGIEKIKIDFKEFDDNKIGIPVLKVNTEKRRRGEKGMDSYLGVMPGTVLYKIYNRYGNRLLEENVRSFLSVKVAVNKRIRGTILKEPKMFFSYNNGIAVVASTVKTEVRDGQCYLVQAEDFQIINGGQTTASIFNAGYKDKAELSDLYVQMKLTSLGGIGKTEDERVDLVKNISRSSNSQNKVSDADFFATHPFHIRMEQISRKTYAPAVNGAQYETKWFYERARGQYLQEQMKLSAAKKKEFQSIHPKKHLIRKTDMAKVQNIWRGLPDIVSKGAQTNFMKFAEFIDEEWSKGSQPFNTQYFQSTVALLIIYQYLEESIQHSSWYEGGYRANVIYYTMALYHELIKKQFPDYDLDLQKIWKRQKLSQVIAVDLMRLAELVYKTITSDERPIENVTQWCKKPGCWNSVKRIVYSLQKRLKDDLISLDDIRVQQKEAKFTQSIENDIAVIKRACEISPNYWARLRKFLDEQRMLSLSDGDVFKAARRLPRQKLTSGQSRRLLKLKQEAEDIGFKG